MSSQHAGMNTYNKILNSCRVDNKPIGPKHHMYDGQLKNWVAQRKAQQGTKPASPITTKPELTATKESLKSKILARVSAPRPMTLRERYDAEAKEKLAATLKVDSRTDHLKSVGNGL